MKILAIEHEIEGVDWNDLQDYTSLEEINSLQHLMTPLHWLILCDFYE
jgi:hypothetical protein